MNKICFHRRPSSIWIKFETKCLPSRKFWWDFSTTSIIMCTNCLPLNKNCIKTNCETRMISITEPPRQVASPDVSASCTSPTKVATCWQQQSDIKFSTALWCAASLLYYIYLRGGVRVSGGKKKKNRERFWKSNDIFPCLSILILHRRVGVRAGWLHMLHPLTAAYKATFISPACIFSEVFFPARRLFLPEPFIPGCVRHILFLVNCLSLSPSSIPLRGLWMQVAPPPKLTPGSRKCTPLVIDDFHFPAASQKYLSFTCPSCTERNINRCRENKSQIVFYDLCMRRSGAYKRRPETFARIEEARMGRTSDHYHFPLRALRNATRNECQIFRGHLSQ